MLQLFDSHALYPVATISALSTRRPYACQLGDQRLIAWRHEQGIALQSAFCPHRQSRDFIARFIEWTSVAFFKVR